MLMRLILLAVAQSLSCSLALAQTDTIRFMVSSTQGTSVARGAEEFRVRVNERLGGQGRLEIVAFRENALPLLQQGEVHLAEIPTVALAAFKVSRNAPLFDLPFFFRDLDEVAALQKSGIGNVLLGELSYEGMVGLAYWNVGMTQFFARAGSLANIREFKDLKGRKLGTAVSPDAQFAINALGIEVRGGSFSNLSQELSSGNVDVAELPSSFVAQGPLKEGSFAEVNYRPIVSAIVANAKFWKTTSFRVQSVLAEELISVGNAVNAEAKRQDTQSITQLEQRFEKVRYSDEERKAFADIARMTWQRVENLQTSGILESALAVQANYRNPSPLPRTDAPVRRPGAVLFATNRVEEADGNGRPGFGAERTEKLQYGVARLTTQSDRPIGSEASVRFTKHDLVPDTELKKEITKLLNEAPNKDVLIYVHGYNTKFKSAVESAQRLREDLHFLGIVVPFTWPSDGFALNYPADEEKVLFSRDVFVSFLKMMSAEAAPNRVHLLAHSMGGRLATESLKLLHLGPAAQVFRLHNVVLAAPDIEIGLYRQSAKAMQALSSRATLYASQSDAALQCSSWLHRGQGSGDRAGEGGSKITPLKGIDTIDVSDVELSQPPFSDPCTNGHSYVHANAVVLSDLHQLLSFDAEPRRRHRLIPHKKDGLEFWKFRR